MRDAWLYSGVDEVYTMRRLDEPSYPRVSVLNFSSRPWRESKGKVLASLLVVLFVVVGLAAQEKVAGEKKKEVRWHGTIVRSDKEGSTVTVQKRGGTAELVVYYSSSTQWTKRNKPADASEFKDGSRVICLGNYDEKNRFVANRIDLQEPAR